jgi:hypothetical protein
MTFSPLVARSQDKANQSTSELGFIITKLHNQNQQVI